MITKQVRAAPWQLEWNTRRMMATYGLSHTFLSAECQPLSTQCQQQTCRHAPTNANCRSSPHFWNGWRGSFSLSRAWLTKGMPLAEQQQQQNGHAWRTTVSGQTLAVSLQGARHTQKQKNTLASEIATEVRLLEVPLLATQPLVATVGVRCAHVLKTGIQTTFRVQKAPKPSVS